MSDNAFAGILLAFGLAAATIGFTIARNKTDRRVETLEADLASTRAAYTSFTNDYAKAQAPAARVSLSPEAADLNKKVGDYMLERMTELNSVTNRTADEQDELNSCVYFYSAITRTIPSSPTNASSLLSRRAPNAARYADQLNQSQAR